VIQLSPPLTLDGRFSAQDLPDALQLPLLNSMAVPRIVSSSMAPTIQAGDRIELAPPAALTIGTIIVFRNDALLVCHRIAAIDPHGTLSTRGDATQNTCEVIQPGSVIGVVTGVMRDGAYVSLGQDVRTPSAEDQLSSLTNRVRSLVLQSIIWSIRALARFQFFQPILTALLRWTATVDVLTPAPLQSLPSLTKVASFTLRIFPHMAGLLTTSIGQKPTQYVLRLGPWRLAQYDPATESLLLRQSLRDAGLESLFRHIFSTLQATWK